MDQNIDEIIHDTRFQDAVAGIVDRRIPRVEKLERYLAAPVLAFALAGSIGVLALASWAGSLAWQRIQEVVAQTAVARLEATLAQRETAADSPSSKLKEMSNVLSATFESQVDSATFKILRFGCTPPKAPTQNRVLRCADAGTPTFKFQSEEDQTIQFVAYPAKQIISLDMALSPIDPMPALEPLFLQIYVEPPSTGREGDDATGRAPLLLKASDILGDKSSGDVLQDGRLRLVAAASFMNVSIDIGTALARQQLTGPIQLRFVPVRLAAKSIASAGALSPEATGPNVYVKDTARSIYFVRTTTSAYHRIRPLKEVQK